MLVDLLRAAALMLVLEGIAPFLAPDLGLTSAMAERLSPAAMPRPPGPLVALFGGDESEEFLRQNRAIREAWGALRVPVCEEVPDRNHLDVIIDLADPQALRGEQVFTTSQCVKCHTPDMATSPNHPMTELRSQTIHPYTDLLLHDMGADLADNMGEGAASGAEWRTPPLWGIGLTAGVSGGEAYLHDGRARSLEEAILWHGGEAERSKTAFQALSGADRQSLLAFLESL